MPSYRYQCDCGVQFEKSVPLSKRQELQSCPECNTPSKQIVPASVDGFFNKEVTGPVPQNTGISQLDVHIDRVIGTHARQGWETHNQRVSEKSKIQVGGQPLSKNPDGSYRVMKPEEQAVQERALTIHKMAMDKFLPVKKPSR